ncbi:ATP-binding protein [Ramlibacter sp.]|uniref:hybrid sensor histidine kinase/response regulator n=1 Tax=Ramlibacter sp. TaxID=1917967 RepID=UPI001845BD44|nr:ATP-binding protein [Ramlibacter sp.]MBA2673805.1 response regulator [Ramlibacter sp.]
MPHPLRPLIDALAQEDGRENAAQALARALGGQHLLMCVEDPEIGVMLPAPGMVKTWAAGASWRELLRRCARESRLQGEVDVLGRRWDAVALVHRGCAFVLLGDEPCRVPAELVEALPLLSEVLRAQQALRIGRAEAADARAAATRAHQLAAALDSARAAAAELNLQLRIEHQHKDEFLAMLAHELRNPLAPMMTGIEILRRLPPEKVGARDRQLAVMSRQMQQLTHLVDDLLDVSRVSRGLIELRREALRLDDVLAAAMEASKPAFVSRRHALVLESRAANMHVNGDRVRLVQVFSNLLNNAAKYTDPGGRIEVDLTEAGAAARVSIRDNGAGIPPKMLDSIFDMFTQVPGSLDRAPGGLGIGLTLVRTLIGLHGGSVEARSAGIGEGSEFIVVLPLVEASPVASQHTELGDPLELSEHVLVVDDNVDAAQTLAEVLRMMGARVTIAHDGAQALEAGASGEPPHLVLLDIGLPGMDGYETAREWRRRFGNRSKLVALTGYGSAEDRQRTARSGFDAHLVKPVTIDVVEQLIRAPSKKAVDGG